MRVDYCRRNWPANWKPTPGPWLSSPTGLSVRARSHEPGPQGIVRVACTEMVATTILLPGLADLERIAPDVRLEIITGVHTSDLTRGEADVALRFLSPDIRGPHRKAPTLV